MAITVTAYDSFEFEKNRGNVDFQNHTIRASLHLAAYTFSAGHTAYADLTNEVATGGGYTLGGLALTGLTITIASNIIKIDSDDNINWGEDTTITADEMVIRDATTDVLLVHIDFGATKTSTSGPFEYILHADGLVRSGANGF